MSADTCAAAKPALQSALQSCGYVFDAAGNSQPPVGMSQTALTACVCSSANVSVFQSSLTSCAANAAAVTSLNALISGCAAATSGGTGTGTGTGVGTGTGTGTKIITPCEIAVGGGIQTLKLCGVTIDASNGSVKQTASDAQTAACACTAGNVLIYKQAQRVCESEISAISTQGIPVFKALVSACASGAGLAGAGTAAGTGASTSAGAGTGSGSTGGVVTTANTAAAPTKSSGADTMFGFVGLAVAGALLI
ncbi:hypothetical protein HDU80_010589 [Chytriomyces hyalinus]|nr:hypothetical protein HDU80_010589 [Chytriomyces hyalinus]